MDFLTLEKARRDPETHSQDILDSGLFTLRTLPVAQPGLPRTYPAFLAVLSSNHPVHQSSITALVWPRYFPDYYDVVDKPSMSLPDELGRQSFPLMRLPVEIRLQIYKNYLVDRYSILPVDIHHKILNSGHWIKTPAEILEVSKAVRAEVQDLLRQENIFKLRICWQDNTFDGFARSCIQARGMRLNYDHIPHLKVEIYPPLQARPQDFSRIWYHVATLCHDLQWASCVRHLSIDFMEDEYAAWSLHGKARKTLNDLDSDILNIFDLFKLLRNVAKVQIHLPASLADDMSMQKLRRETMDVIMTNKSLDDESQK